MGQRVEWLHRHPRARKGAWTQGRRPSPGRDREATEQFMGGLVGYSAQQAHFRSGMYSKPHVCEMDSWAFPKDTPFGSSLWLKVPQR